MADEEDVGSIVARLRLDGGGEWELTLRRAQEQAEALGRVNPVIRITTNSAELTAQLAAVRGELDALKGDNIRLRFDLTQAQTDLARLREESRRQGEISGRDFGAQFSRTVRQAMAALPKADVDADTDPAQVRLQAIRAQIEELSTKRIGVDLGADEAMAKLAALRAELGELGRTADNVQIRFDTGVASASLARLQTQLNRLDIDDGHLARSIQTAVRKASAAIPRLDVDADTSPADRRLQELRGRLVALGEQRVGVDISAAEALAKLRAVQEELDKLNRKARDDVRIRVDTAAASARIAALRAQIAGLDGGSKGTDGGGPSLMFGAIIAGALLAGPLVAATTAAVVEGGAAAGVAALAYKGLKDQEEEATGVGLALKSTTHGIGAELKDLAATAGNEAAPGVLAALTRIKVFIPTMDGTVAGLAHHLGDALNIGAGGTVRALTVMKPLMAEAGVDAERLAQKWADFAASPEFARFIAYAERELPIVGKDLGDIGGALINVGVALQPVGDKVLNLVDHLALGTTKATELLGALNELAQFGGGKDGGKDGTFGRFVVTPVKKAVKQAINPVGGLLDLFPSDKPAPADAAATEAKAKALANQTAALASLAAQYGVTGNAYKDADAAIAKNADQLAAGTLQMKLQNDAAGLLGQALDKLSGGNAEAASAENRFEQDLVSLAKKVHGADASLVGMSSSAITNRGEIIRLRDGAVAAAEAYGKMTDAQGHHIHDTEQSRQKLIALRKSIIDNAVAWGEDKTQVTKLVDSILTIPPKATTKGVLETTGADDALNAYKKRLAGLPKSIQTAVLLSGISTAEFQLQLLARNRRAQITVDIGGPGATGVRSVGGVQAHADGGTISGAGGPRDDKVLIAASPGEEIIKESQASRYRPLLKAINANKFADGGTVGGDIVSLTPSASSTAAAAKKAKAKKAKPVNVPLVVTVGGGAAYGISSYIKGQIPSATAAMRDLSTSVNAAFQMRGAQARIASLKADLDNLRQEKAAFSGGVTSSLMGQVDVTKYGDAQMLADALSGGRNANAKFTGQEQKLAKEGVPEELIRALTQNVNSAGLDTVAGLAPGSAMLRQIIGQYQAFAGSATRGGVVAGSSAYDSQIRAAETKASQAAIDAAHDRAVMLRSLAMLGRLVQQPAKMYIDGKEVAHVVIASHEFNGVIDDLTGHLVLGRRP